MFNKTRLKNMFILGYLLGACAIGIVKIILGIDFILEPTLLCSISGSVCTNYIIIFLDVPWNLVSLIAILPFVLSKKLWLWLLPLSYVLFSLTTIVLYCLAMLFGQAHLFGTTAGLANILFGLFFTSISFILCRKLSLFMPPEQKSGPGILGMLLS